MGLRNFFGEVFKSGTVGLGTAVSPSPTLFGGKSWAGRPVTDQTALQISSVFACVRNIAEDIGKMKPVLVELTRDEQGRLVRSPALNHPVHRLLRQPNSFQDQAQFLETLGASLAMRGNAFAMLLRDGRGVVQSMVPLHPDRVTLMQAPDGALWYQVSSSGSFETVMAGGPMVYIPARDMLHVRLFSLSGLMGLSPIGYAVQTLGLASVMEEYQSRLFANGARPGGVLRHPGKISKEAWDRLVENWRGVFEGAQNSGKTAILEEGMEWTALGMTSVDAEFLATRKFTVEEIARVFRMPLHMIGQLDRSTNNNIAQQSLEYYTNTLSAYLNKIESAMNRALDLGTKHEVSFDVWDVLKLDMLTLMRALQTGKTAGIMTTNEARGHLRLNPKPGGDVLQQPLNMGAINEQGANDPNAENGRPPEGDAQRAGT